MIRQASGPESVKEASGVPAAGAGGDLRALDIRIEPFAPVHLPIVASFSERHWSRPRSEAYYHWRYLEPQPFSRMFIARTGDACVGMVCALRKNYLIGGVRSSCLEVFDWHCLPGLRGSGVGIRVMRAMMRAGERLLSVGGTADVLSTLPAMGWQRIGCARMYELPLSGEFLQPGLRDYIRFHVPGERLALDGAAFAWFRPRRRHRFPGGEVFSSARPEGDLATLYEGRTGYGVLQVADTRLLEWVSTRFSTPSGLNFIQFVVKGTVRGWAMARIFDTPRGREAALLELFAPNPDEKLYAWMVSEAAASLARFRPRVIRARASCPILQAALRANRFMEGEVEIPIHTWPRNLPEGLRPHITLNHSDEPLRPYGPGDAAGSRGALP